MIYYKVPPSNCYITKRSLSRLRTHISTFVDWESTWQEDGIPDEAFKNYNPDYPGIILTHNPDTAPVKGLSRRFIFSGHTHGGQVNLPYMWRRFTVLENMRFKKGLFKEHGKWIYVNRGIGSAIIPFRWFSPPEILLATLTKS